MAEPGSVAYPYRNGQFVYRVGWWSAWPWLPWLTAKFGIPGAWYDFEPLPTPEQGWHILLLPRPPLAVENGPSHILPSEP